MSRPTLRACGGVLFLTILCGTAAGQAPPPRSKSKPAGYLLRGVRVVDVEAGTLTPPRDVLITGAEIVRIGEPQPGEPPAGHVAIDCSNRFLMPGLCDAHVHYIEPYTYGRLMIAHGVTLVRDMGSATETIVRQRDALNSGKEIGPQMVCTGAIVDGRPPVWPFSEPCETPEEGRAAVRRLAKAGVNQIKVYSMLRADVFAAVVDEAAKHNLRAVGHVPESVPIADAMRAGMASNEHLTGFGSAIAALAGKPISTTQAGLAAHIEAFRAWALLPDVPAEKLDELFALARERGMVQCPTLVVYQGLGRGAEPEKADKDRRMRYVPHWVASFWSGGRYGDFAKYAATNLDAMIGFVGRLHRAGVPLMVGTDLANPYVFAGASVHDEMKLFAKAGIPPADVLRAATLTPARFVGLGDRLGSVAAGKLASLVLLRADPLTDVGNVREIDAVFLRGRYFDRDGLNRLLRQARQRASKSQPKPQDVPVKLEAPGEVFARGSYKVFLNDTESGTEQFLVTREGERWHVVAHLRWDGPWQPSSFSHVRADGQFQLEQANWQDLTETGTRAAYQRKGNAIEVSAQAKGQPATTQSYEIAPGGWVSGPSIAGGLLLTRSLDLKAGESKKVTVGGFGIQGWRIEPAEMTYKRLEDGELERPGGAKVKARHYSTRLAVPNFGTFSSEEWTDERGLVLRSKLTMPFGTVVTVLQEPTEK